ncbi:hypothetical protein EVG20_g11016 [Dentipellis fragilis]|uniref:Uncharacterized protein n=1 Tax=Dentipellis fragilis TaxID=205917 RepID=A0A4Y9XQC7_9AGAM|nr:hypothetical protein EVG20_g11016 [Dentipellis fragilis]
MRDLRRRRANATCATHAPYIPQARYHGNCRLRRSRTDAPLHNANAGHQHHDRPEARIPRHFPAFRHATCDSTLSWRVLARTGTPRRHLLALRNACGHRAIGSGDGRRWDGMGRKLWENHDIRRLSQRDHPARITRGLRTPPHPAAASRTCPDPRTASQQERIPDFCADDGWRWLSRTSLGRGVVSGRALTTWGLPSGSARRSPRGRNPEISDLISATNGAGQRRRIAILRAALCTHEQRQREPADNVAIPPMAAPAARRGAEILEIWARFP